MKPIISIVLILFFFTFNKVFSQDYDGTYSVVSSYDCDIKFILMGNKYKAIIDQEEYEGGIEYSFNNNSGEMTFLDLKGSYPKEDIRVSYEESTIFIQNYGNSMSDFLKFNTCGDKFIVMKKDT